MEAVGGAPAVVTYLHLLMYLRYESGEGAASLKKHAIVMDSFMACNTT